MFFTSKTRTIKSIKFPQPVKVNDNSCQSLVGQSFIEMYICKSGGIPKKMCKYDVSILIPPKDKLHEYCVSK